MKYIYKKIFAIIMLLTIGDSMLAYTFGITNETDKKLVLRVKQRAWGGIYWAIVEPGDRVAFEFGNANCLEWIKWAEFNPKKPYNGGQDLITENGVDNAKFEKLGYGLRNSEIVMLPGEVFDETVAGAKELVKGHDKLACAIIDQVKSFMGIKAAEEVASGIGRGGKDKEETSLIAAFTKQVHAKPSQDNALKLILEMRVKKTEWLKLITQDAYDNVIDLLKPGTKEGNEAAEAFMNQALFDGPKAKTTEPERPVKKPVQKELEEEEEEIIETGPFSGYDIKVWQNFPAAKKAMDAKKNEKEIARLVLNVTATADSQAIANAHKTLLLKWHPDKNKEKEELATQVSALINAARKVLLPSEIDNKVEYNARISSCCNNDVNTYVDKITKPEIINCNFGLKTIAGAAGKLAAISLCKDREYQLVEKVGGNERTKIPEMWAYTVRGE